MNVELGTKVLEYISQNPEHHNQGEYEVYEDDRGPSSECGMTRCIAGWAIALSAPESWDGNYIGDATRLIYHTDPRSYLNKMLEVQDSESIDVFATDYYSWGKILLDLTYYEADSIFYGSDDTSIRLLQTLVYNNSK